MMDEERVAAAERVGRTERRTEFQIREPSKYEVLPDDPRRYVLEVIRGHGGGSTAHLNTVTEADLKALASTCAQALNGFPLPVGDAR